MLWRPRNYVPGTNDSQCLGSDAAGNRRTRTSLEPRPGPKRAQGVATQVAMVAIDLTLIPYHGKPALDKKEIFRGEPKSGTTHFHAYATAVVVHKGYRYTLALTRVEYGDSMKEVVQRLLAIVRRRGVKIRYLLLDKGFFSVEVMRYLHRAGLGFILPAVVRGKKPKNPKTPPHGLRALLKKKNGYYRETIGATPDGRRAGEPISHGANPRAGFRSDGAATAMVKAIAAIQPGYGNTAP